MDSRCQEECWIRCYGIDLPAKASLQRIAGQTLANCPLQQLTPAGFLRAPRQIMQQTLAQYANH